MNSFKIENREIGDDFPPLVIAEIGINHEGSFTKAKQMVKDAYDAGCECVKFQCHIIEDEMSAAAKEIIPEHTEESIWEIIKRCELTENEEIQLKEIVEQLGMTYMSTPFSRAAAIRLQKMGVPAFKIGSGECNNYPLIKLVASFGKPVILSTGMNDISSIKESVNILRSNKIPYALTHCTSIYPTPYNRVRLGALKELRDAFPDAVLGLSDHTLSNYPCLASIPLGGRILERHFTSSKDWAGPDINISMDPSDLKEMIFGASTIFQSLGGSKQILPEEQPTIDFAYATAVTIQDIKKGETFTEQNLWVKRPGVGEIKAKDFEKIIGKTASRNLSNDSQITWDDITG